MATFFAYAIGEHFEIEGRLANMMKPSDLIRPLQLTMFVAVSIAFSPAAWAGEIEGRAKPVDGDSFNIEIRIFGIDAPESRQTCKDAKGGDYPCGQRANEAMEKLLSGNTVYCEKVDQDTRYGRPVAICIADGVDVGAAMVDQGLAVAYREYSDKYVPNESRAKAAKRGLWAGTFEMPWDYRKRIRSGLPLLPAASSGACPPPPAEGSECKIKGNKGKSGRIYHVPGSRSYESVKLNKKGERYFCSVQDAIACGWRKPK